MGDRGKGGGARLKYQTRYGEDLPTYYTPSVLTRVIGFIDNNTSPVDTPPSVSIYWAV